MVRRSSPHSLFGTQMVVLSSIMATILLSASPLIAADAAGTKFWLAFEENFVPGMLSLLILGESGTTGMVAVAGLGFSSPFTIPASGLSTVALPAGSAVTASDGVENLGVHVLVSRPVVVYGLSLQAESSDSFLALPEPALGTAYYTVSYTPDPGLGVFESQFAVIGTADGTQVTVTPTATIGPHPAGGTYQIMIDTGQVYQAQSSGDLTGTSIVADHPVAVLSGNPATNVPSGSSAADHLAEQLLPTAQWGTDLFVVPSALRTAPERSRIQAALAGTTLTYSSDPACANLNAGQFCEAVFGPAVRIQSNQPISVAHFANGGNLDDGTGDPFLFVELAAGRFAHGYWVATADDGTIFPSNFVNLVVPSAAVGLVTLDGGRIPSGSYTTIGTTGFSFCRPAVAPGAHRLSGPRAFGAAVYGFGSYVSYASPAGGSSLPFADGFEAGDDLAWSSVVP